MTMHACVHFPPSEAHPDICLIWEMFVQAVDTIDGHRGQSVWEQNHRVDFAVVLIYVHLFRSTFGCSQLSLTRVNGGNEFIF